MATCHLRVKANQKKDRLFEFVPSSLQLDVGICANFLGFGPSGQFANSSTVIVGSIPALYPLFQWFQLFHPFKSLKDQSLELGYLSEQTTKRLNLIII